jgi:hypothetical protein
MERKRLTSTLASGLLGLTALMLFAATAYGDSATISAVDAGGGQMTGTVTVTKSCSRGESCAWFPTVVERHSSLPCSSDTTFLRWVGAFHEHAETETASFTFKPFFPRYTKLCVLLSGTPVGEAVIALPPGYGVQRSTANNCSNFASRAAAQYYLELYPSDPSRLDADHDGQACEDNKCPCGAEAIPPEPEPAPAVVVVPTEASGPSAACTEARHASKHAKALVEAARRHMRDSFGPASKRYWRETLRNRRATLKKDERRAEGSCA